MRFSPSLKGSLATTVAFGFRHLTHPPMTSQEDAVVYYDTNDMICYYHDDSSAVIMAGRLRLAAIPYHVVARSEAACLMD